MVFSVTYSTEEDGEASQMAKRATYQDNTLTSTRDNSTTISLIKAAIIVIKLLKLEEKFSYYKVVLEYSYNYTTLARRH